MRSLLFVVLIALLVGCQQQGPLTTHGKPVGHWVEALKDRDAKARKKAVVALGHAGTADPAALPALISAVKDRDAGVRREAVLALLNLGPDARSAVPVLTEAQTDKDAKVREYAGKALERVQAGK
jgi:HEAT repeat protein